MKKGIVFALFTAIISGFSIFYNKLVIIKGIDPLIFNIIKNGGVAIILSLLLIPQINIKSFTYKYWLKLILIGLIGGCIPFFLFFEGLKSVSATNANLIHKSLFIWTALMAIPLLGEKLNILQIAGYAIVAISNIFFFGLSGFEINSGMIMIFAATLLWSAELILVKITLKDIDYKIVAWGRMAIGSLFLIVFAVIQGKMMLFAKLTMTEIMPIFTGIIFLTGYVVSLYKALKFAPVTIVASVLILSTPITNILSSIFITGQFPRIHFINLTLTVIGIILISHTIFHNIFCFKEVSSRK